jgi:hypothetical protein
MSSGRGAAESPENPQEELRHLVSEANKTKRHMESMGYKGNELQLLREQINLDKQRLILLEEESKENKTRFRRTLFISILAFLASIVAIILPYITG